MRKFHGKSFAFVASVVGAALMTGAASCRSSSRAARRVCHQKRPCWTTTVVTGSGHGTKSLRDSPLTRGGSPEGAVTKRGDRR
jgi:hypothetical protein